MKPGTVPILFPDLRIVFPQLWHRSVCISQSEAHNARVVVIGGRSWLSEIVAMALLHMTLAKDDPRWHWVLVQPPRGASGDPVVNEGHFRCLELLLTYGIDANVGRKSATVIHLTAARGGLDEASRVLFAEILLNHGARTDLRDDILKSTPLGWACRWGRLKMAGVLLKRGALVDEFDAELWATPIAWAQKWAIASSPSY